MTKKLIINLIVLSLILVPVLAMAQQAPASTQTTGSEGLLVPECGGKDKAGNVQPDCNFRYFFLFISDIIEFLIFYLSIPIAVILFLYAGFLYLFSPVGANKDKAKKIFWSVLWGFVIMLGAWVFIEFILKSFLNPTFLEKVKLAP